MSHPEESDLPDQIPVPEVAVGPIEPVKPDPVPFDRAFLQGTFLRPHRLLEVVLSERERLVANVARNEHLLHITLLMAAGSVLFALPYGAVLGIERMWDVAWVYVGSAAICFPCLQVFSAYLGVKINLLQNLILALTVTSAAALFCFGFFPILWFLDRTMDDGRAAITIQHISIGLLTVALVMGLSQLNRCLFLDKALRKLRSNPLLLTLWQGLLVFITYRMAVVLQLV